MWVKLRLQVSEFLKTLNFQENTEYHQDKRLPRRQVAQRDKVLRGHWATGWDDSQTAPEDIRRGTWPRIPMRMGGGAWLFFFIKTKGRDVRY